MIPTGTTTCSCNGDCRQTTDLVETVEAIRRRQTAKLCDHLRNTGQATPRLEADVCRSLHYMAVDITDAITTPPHEQTTETRTHAKRTH